MSKKSSGPENGESFKPAACCDWVATKIDIVSLGFGNAFRIGRLREGKKGLRRNKSCTV
jgi:hypothetical protein